MRIEGVSIHDCRAIASRLGIVFDGEDISNTRGIRTTGRLRGVSGVNPYPRLGFARTASGDRRKMPSAVCWHGYRDFIRAVFDVNPTARVKTGRADYRGADDFESSYPATGDVNVGSYYDPIDFASLCYCQDAGETN